MGDTEPMFAQTSTTMDYSNSGYNPVGYGDGSSTASAAQGTTEVGEFSVSTTATESAAINQTTTGQDSYATPAYDAKGTFGLTTSDQDMVSLQSVAMDSSGAGGYASYQNGSAACDVSHAVSSENGNVSHNVGVGADVQLLEDGSVSAVSAMSAEEERLWSIVSANSLDFDAWVALIEETEKVAEGNILKLRRVYDSFLAEFPLCYGYWKKYADHEALGSTDKAVEVYERAVQAVTYSVDIWLHYCRFAISKYEEPDIIRRLFERGLEYVGTDYLSYTLWDEYIEYEYKHQEWSHIAGIYTRVFESPILYLDKYYNSFKELAASRPVSELRTAEEASAAAAAANSVSESTTHVNEGDIGSDAVEQSTKPVSAGSTEAEELEKYIAIRDEMYRKAKEFDSKIVGFETAIGRPYFHVKPLNVAELENWHNYLNFMEREDDFSKVVKLYERCLVACANYPEFWIRYVKCMETRGSMDLAENALVRATQVFVKRQPEIHLFAAWFKEHNGDTAGARAAYQLVHTEISPGLLEAIIKHANMERRLGNIDDGLSVYEQAIAIEKGKEHSQALPILFAQYARFLYLAPGKLEKARDLLVEAPEHVQLSKPFLEALMCLETVIPMPKRIEYIDMLVEKFIVPNSDNPNVSSISEREELSCIYLEFLDLLGDASAIKKAHDRHLKLFFNNRSSSLSRKRQADDLSSEKSKLPKSDPSGGSAVQSLMGAYPSAAAQNQWNTAYGVQPQAWPQAAQAPVQQWNPGYPQQSAAYGAYGAAYPQATAPAAQTAAYGAYPATYPAQTYSQQSYAQPTAAAAAPTSQTTSVPQAYYGSYY